MAFPVSLLTVCLPISSLRQVAEDPEREGPETAGTQARRLRRVEAPVTPERPTALIVGVRTLGHTLALHFAERGFRVLCAARTRQTVEDAAAAVTAAGGLGVPLVCDLTRPETLKAALAAEPVIDLCIAAQTAGGRFGARPLVEMEDEELQRGFESYLRGTWNLLRAVGPRMLARGQGTFLQIGTSSGVRTKAGYAALAAVQHGLRALVQVAAREWREGGVHVAYLPIDGAIASEKTTAWVARNGEDRAIPAQAIAEACAYLHGQPRRGWTHELLLRPPGSDWTAPT